MRSPTSSFGSLANGAVVVPSNSLLLGKRRVC